MSFTSIYVSFQPPMVCVDADYDQLSDFKFSHNDKVRPFSISQISKPSNFCLDFQLDP